MGRSHARVLAGMPTAELVAVSDIDEARCNEVAREHSTSPTTDYRGLVGAVDAVSIAVPTDAHAEVAGFFLERGVSVLVEKPMTRNSREGEKLVAAAEMSGAKLMVGHIERFNPAFMAINEMEVKPLFIECDRISPFRFRSGDIGVVFDLMIHDLDIALYLAKSPVKRIDAVGVSVISPSEDICNARIVFENGCVANVTASRVSTKSMRKIRLFSAESYITIDYAARQAMIYRKSPKLTLEVATKLKRGATSLADFAGMSFPELLDVRNVEFDDHEPLAKELEAFINCVESGSSPPVTGRDGLEAIAVAERVLESVAEHARLVES